MTKRSTIINFSVAALLTFTSSLGPAWAQGEVLDRLFEELQQAEPEDASRIEGQIVALRGKSGSAALDLLMKRGEDALAQGDTQVALEHFSALVDHDPQFAEGYNGRATAYYLTGRFGPALDDIRAALRLNPRHFGALRGLAIILEELERPEQSLEIYREVLAINPHAEGVTEAVDRLKIELEGRSL